MSEYTQYYESFCQGRWASEKPEDCRCHGSGWALSEVDTWHQCHSHYTGQRHPEDDQPYEPTNPEEAAYFAAIQAERAAHADDDDDTLPF